MTAIAVHGESRGWIVSGSALGSSQCGGWCFVGFAAQDVSGEGLIVLAVLGNATSSYAGASVLGHASGAAYAVSITGDANGDSTSGVAGTIAGNATGVWAASVLGDATGRKAVAGAGNARSCEDSGCYAVSATGHASGDTAVSVCDALAAEGRPEACAERWS